ncbi:response regulator transcription factor [Ideonella margarita]|uniref:Response regulator n=1 Tax=Ideonella margarita TaxID=2984191 RepID=A0ABU9C2V2_9BURK
MSRRVLTIDDQTDIRRLIRMTLEFEGFDVLEAGSGPEGLEMAWSKKPDLILLDVMMPGMSGLTVASMLRTDERLKHIPVVMLTALDRESDMEAGLATGAQAYLAKPFSPMELLDVVERLITESQARR